MGKFNKKIAFDTDETKNVPKSKLACLCGSIVNFYDRKKHEKTEKHRKYEEEKMDYLYQEYLKEEKKQLIMEVLGYLPGEILKEEDVEKYKYLTEWKIELFDEFSSDTIREHHIEELELLIESVFNENEY